MHAFSAKPTQRKHLPCPRTSRRPSSVDLSTIRAQPIPLSTTECTSEARAGELSRCSESPVHGIVALSLMTGCGGVRLVGVARCAVAWGVFHIRVLRRGLYSRRLRVSPLSIMKYTR
ncbi:uncharacterized protein LAESUDRAFT_323740 [Laetiporus sulphureus 93-53]|uniref:Uncharacterized protein n=1 Tax=Laetiporus sulphureus 93-53 TaxID=1314785 RepID=A0A165CYE3_9APHY|nr:uncharacterized protein LAESUDRAFT_323740 [Laetiporus sulphureus 93-53]KZT03743.1 hypothetical protein LAESUDRAFT_323740 [Laetiporus sulphureus 93-53]